VPASPLPLATSAAPTTGNRIGRYRWTICALLFFATTINYIDRNSLSVLKTTIERQLNWSEADYGWIAFAFTAAYAAFPSIFGRLIDRDEKRLQLLPPGAGGRQQIVANPPWIAVASKLVRGL